MSKLALIVKSEYLTEIKSKSFWISTFLLPLAMVAFGAFIGYLAASSDGMDIFMSHTTPQNGDDLTGAQALGMVIGVFLTLFIMIYGSSIFNKVKNEKTNRIAEVLISCVPGRTMMLAKVLSVGLVGLTQIFVWIAMIGAAVFFVIPLIISQIPVEKLLSLLMLKGVVTGLLYFAGGFFFYASLFAVAGAVTDRNNENQGYLSLLTLLLMASFYLGIYSVDSTGALATVCFYLPFTSPTVGTVQVIGGIAPWWQGLISLIILYASAAFVLMLAGKIYTSSILLKGKKLSPKDLLVFIKAK